MGLIIDQNPNPAANDTWALVLTGVIVNTIDSDLAGITVIQSDYDYLVDLDIQGQEAGIGWTYNSGTNIFAPPSPPANDYTIIVQADFDEIVNDLLQTLSDIYVAGQLSPDQVAAAFAASLNDSTQNFSPNMDALMNTIYNFMLSGG